MTDRQDDITRLEQRIESLRKEKQAALEALGLAASLGTFDTAGNRCVDPMDVIRELTRRVTDMLDFSHCGVYVNNETTNEFELTHCSPEGAQPYLADEVDALIRDHSFSWALRRSGPAFFLSTDRSRQLMLHVLTTRTRIRGMFVGVMSRERAEIPDTTLALLTVILSSAANALENCRLYGKLEEANRYLENRIEQRTRDLQSANEQLNVIIQTVPAGIVLVDAETKTIAEINQTALDLVGLAREDVIGTSCKERFCDGVRDCCPCLNGAACNISCDRTMRGPDGQPIHLVRSAVPVVLGERRYLLDSFVDITEHRKLAKLREDVEQITRHDLKTPLNGIIALPDIILDRWQPDHPEARGMLRMIKDAGLKMLRMINLSHDLFKMETGKYHYLPTNMDLTPQLRSMLVELEDLRLSRRVEVRVVMDGEPADLEREFPILGEELLVYSMLSNIVKNALEAAPRMSAVTIRLDHGDPVVIQVHNEGAVPEAIRPTFFDKFSTLNKKGGSGLGTYSARLIAVTMGGSIDFTTSEEQGTTIIVRLPSTLPGPMPHKGGTD